MLNLALVALLSGALLTGTPGDDRDKDKGAYKAPTAEAADAAVPSTGMIVAPAEPRAITNLTYAFGRPSDVAPLKAWVAYAWGESEGVWAADGETVDYDLNGPEPGEVDGDIVSQRVHIGAQINFLNFPAFKVGLGGELVAGSNTFQFGENNPLREVLGVEQLESDFGLQQAKAFVSLRGRVVGIHGGFQFDLAEAVAEDDPDFVTSFPRSDDRDAFFLGADFDYPSERFRLFGGIDYFRLQEEDEIDAVVDQDNIVSFNMGAGLRFGFVELGAALLLRTKLEIGTGSGLADGPRTSEDGDITIGTTASGGHAGTIAPYLKLSPPTLPVSLFVKGAVLNEYTDYGYAIGGANDIKPSIGFTAGLTLGFD